MPPGVADRRLFSFAANLLLLNGPLYMLQLLDWVLTSGSTDTLIMLTVLAVGALIVNRH